MEWFAAGGWSMWFLMVFGALCLFAAAGFARRPDPAQLPRIAALSRAVGWSTLVGVATDFAAVGYHIPAQPEWAHSPDMPLLVLQGLAESMSPVVLGGAVLSVTSLLIAAGHARLHAQGVAP